MWGSPELLLLWFLVLVAAGTRPAYRPSRRVCAVVGAAQGPISESFVQRVYQPFLTTCDGHRACSTYRTIYRTAYRRGPGLAPARPRFACCPGWKRTSGLPGACATAICQPPCGNGGSCVRPGHCHCPAGWRGNTCHTDVDECSSGGAGCPQGCVNTAGSYWCQCWEGHSPSADGTRCLPTAGPPKVTPNTVTGLPPCRPSLASRSCHLSAGDGTLLLLVRAVTLQTRTVSNNAPSAARHQDALDLAATVASVSQVGGSLTSAGSAPGVDPAARAEVQRLHARVEALEQKLQLVLAPLHGLASRAPEHGPQDPGSLLAHSLQQLDRIDSLSEQISFLEEQLGSCSCKEL